MLDEKSLVQIFLDEMSADSSKLPPVRKGKSRPSSSAERSDWSKVLHTQRRISVDVVRSELVRSTTKKKSTMVASVAKPCPRLQRTFTPKSDLNISSSSSVPATPITSSVASYSLPAVSSEKVLPQKVTPAKLEPVTRPKADSRTEVVSDEVDHGQKLLLEGTQLLEKLSKTYSDWGTTSTQAEVLREKWLQLKCLIEQKYVETIKSDLLKLTVEMSTFVSRLETMYTEDAYKLEVAQDLGDSEEATRKKAVESFVASSSARRNLVQETQKKFKENELVIKNLKRLVSVSQTVPKNQILYALIEKIKSQVDLSAQTSLYWIHKIITANIEMMCSYIDSLPFDTIASICFICESFNTTFEKNLIDLRLSKLDVLLSTAKLQASLTSKKLAYLLQTEMKVLSVKSKVNEDEPDQISANELDQTSDYCTGSATSTRTLDQNSLVTKCDKHIDFQSLLQIIVSCNQRILLKLMFANQKQISSDANKRSATTTSSTTSSRRTWYVDNRSQSNMFRECDHLYWSAFWSHFTQSLIDNLRFLNVQSTSSSLYLSPLQFTVLIAESMESVIYNDDLSTEVTSSLSNVYLNMKSFLTSQLWCPSLNVLDKEIKLFFGSSENEILEVNNEMYTSLGLHFLKTLQLLMPLIANLRDHGQLLFAITVNRANTVVEIFCHSIESQIMSLHWNQVPSLILLLFGDIQIVLDKFSEEVNIELEVVHESLLRVQKVGFKVVCQKFHTMSQHLVDRALQQPKSNGKVPSIWMENCISSLEIHMNMLMKLCNTQNVKELRVRLVESFSNALLNNHKKLIKKKGLQSFIRDTECFIRWATIACPTSAENQTVQMLMSLTNYRFNKLLPDFRHNKVSPSIRNNTLPVTTSNCFYCPFGCF